MNNLASVEKPQRYVLIKIFLVTAYVSTLFFKLWHLPSFTSVNCLPVANTFLILAVYTIELRRSKPQLNSVLLFWIFNSLLHAVAAWSFHLQGPPRLSYIELALCILSSLLTSAEWALPWRPLDNVARADFVSLIFFNWLNPLLSNAYRRKVTFHDLPELGSSIDINALSERFLENWKNSAKTSTGVCICILKVFKKDISLLIFFNILSTICDFLQPFVLELLIVFVDKCNREPHSSIAEGIYMSLAILALKFGATFFLAAAQIFAFRLEVGTQGALYGAIYRQAMYLSPKAREESAVSDIVNHLTVDSSQIVACLQRMNDVVVVPLQLIVCFACMYWFLGLYFLVGVATILLLIPYNSYFTTRVHEEFAKSMKATDARTQLISSVLSNIKTVKFHAWELPFFEKLSKLRSVETHYFKRLRLFNIPVESIWDMQPFILATSTFGAIAAFSSRPLNAATIFPSLSLFFLIKNPMVELPSAFVSLARAWVSFERLSSFFGAATLAEFESRVTYLVPEHIQSDDDTTNIAVSINNATVAWNESYSSKIALRDINLTVKKGELCCIVGRVGSGKSALCKAICGLLSVHSGTIECKLTLGYVSQSPWLRNETIRDNIVFQSSFDEEWFDKVVDACALREDLLNLPDGSNTLVGEKGYSLSGGQKARVSLARAIYSKADVLILDDVLSAVDEYVSSHIIKHVLSRNTGIVKDKSIIFATNSFKVLKEATSIWTLNDGILYQGAAEWDASVMSNQSNNGRGGEDRKQKQFEQVGSDLMLENGNDDERLIERVAEGRVKAQFYSRYIHAGGLGLLLVSIVMLLIMGLLAAFSSVWLKFWVDNDGQDAAYYLSIYMVIAVLSTVANAIALYLVTAKFGINASIVIHNEMTRSLLRSPMSFFETTSLGRILNRFTSDIANTIDIEALWTIFNFLFFFFKLIFILVVLVFSTPSVAVILAPLTFIYIYYVRYYIESCRQLKRIESTSRSPVLSHFEDSMKGHDVISAAKCKAVFIATGDSLANKSTRASYVSMAVDVWFLVRLRIVGSILIFVTSLIGVFMASQGKITSSFFGLAIANSLEALPRMISFFRRIVNLERLGVSLERAMEYSDLPPEAPEIVEGNRPPIEWPSHGSIEFKNYSAKYREDMDMALSDINLVIKPQEKIGIVGRTGAGKSTLTLALFRIIEAAKGQLSIDGVNTAAIGLTDLRRNLSIIPQDAQIIAGTIRDNLDPFQEHDDLELWQILELCHLKDHVQSLNGLDAELHDNGRNLSRGQAQLICLARALLDNSQILVLDEATASVDPATDAIVQQTIRTEFKNKTILTIAHRLNTIMDSDRILVLDHGRIIENGKPEDLKKDPDSAFYKLLTHDARATNTGEF